MIGTEINDVNFIAHRGYSASAPENTIPAFEMAKDNGYDTVECDISWTKDEIPVLLHDDTINRTARHKSGFWVFFKKFCSDLTYNKLLDYDFGIWKNKDFKGTKIPTFEETLEYCKDNDLNLYIDLKSNDDFSDKKAKMLVEMVEEADMEDNVSWISFEEDNLEKIQALLPDARLGYLSKTEVSEETIDVLENLKNDENEVFLDIKAKYADTLPDDFDFGLEAWKIKSVEQIEELIKMGFDGFTTDNISETTYKSAIKD